ncbi:WD40-repeat-containing domain protein [Baffinella frigidus]|nr:WD40-repeat-containing domain protein [Cryptophyta sp. CCMP2293]
MGLTMRVVFSEDNKYLLTASADCSAGLFDVGSCEEKLKLEGHDGEVLDAIFLLPTVSACRRLLQGRQAVSSSYDKTIKLWDCATAECVLTLTGHLHVIYGLDVSRKEDRLLTCSSDNFVKIWDLDEGVELQTLQFHDAAVMCCSNPFLCITLQFHDAAVICCALDPRGEWVVTGSTDHTVRLYEIGSETPAVVVGRHDEAVCYIRFSRDGQFIFSAGAEGIVRKWEWSVAYQVATDTTPDHDSAISSIEISVTGRHLLSLDTDGRCIVRLIDWRGNPLASFLLTDTDDPAFACRFSPDGELVASLHAFGALIWRAKTGELVGRNALATDLMSMVFPDEVEDRIARPQSPILAPPEDATVDATAGKKDVTAGEEDGRKKKGPQTATQKLRAKIEKEEKAIAAELEI